MNQKKNKKSQTEIFGLAIIVSLLAFGLILVLSFSGNSSSSPELKEINNELAGKFVSTYLSTSTDCNDLSIQDLIIDIADYSPSGSVICDNGLSSLEYLDSITEVILNNSVAVWKPDKFELMVYLNEATPILKKGTLNCNSKVGEAYPLSVRSNAPVNVRLSICY